MTATPLTGRRRTGRRPAFTIVEVLVTIAVITALLGILLPALDSVRRRGEQTREMSAGRQLMLAYTAYAGDHGDAVMPGYLHGLPTRDDRGGHIGGEPAARYPWRIFPYLDSTMEAIYVGQQRELLARLKQTSHGNYIYTASLSPALGLNATWMGGNASDDELGFDDEYLEIFGRFYVTNLSEVRRPTQLMVFTSARGQDPLVEGLGPVEGYYRITSPRLTSLTGERWAEDPYDPDAPPADYGFVSFRHDDMAVCAFVDGHVDSLDEPTLRDMRHWANRARSEDYALKPR
jgi:prepilin-type processing-associated H-X9-DG protein